MPPPLLPKLFISERTEVRGVAPVHTWGSSHMLSGDLERLSPLGKRPVNRA